MDYNNIKKQLEQYNQTQLLQCYEEFSNENKIKLLKQIEELNFDEIKDLYIKATSNLKSEKTFVEPIEYTDKEKISQDLLNKYNNLGNELLKSGKIAAVTMAGGQGTRLGHKGPKGTYNIGISNGKSLFEIICNGFKKVQKEFGTIIPWYIMTSEENNEETEQFFIKNNYFEYPKEAIKFFKQGQYPMIDKNGKILLNEEGFVKEAADGHGGVYIAMYKNGILEDMKQKGIEHVEICGVDNILVNLFDPVFLGLYLSEGTVAASKSVVKKYPEEKVGVFCKKNGKPSIIEYSELSEEMSYEKDEKGELKYGESNIIVHIFKLSELERISKNILPFHPAFKKANYMNEKGEIVVATEPNAYKFEAFIFDAFEQLENMTILRVKREDEFAPIKNSDDKGVDCPKTAKELYLKHFNLKE